jgi:UDP-N-acetylglucosamine 2-epimerase (non-hydrolysing)
MAGARSCLPIPEDTEETTVLNISCLTLRKNTERPVTITEGTNRLVDPENIDAIVAAVDKTLAGPLAPASGRSYGTVTPAIARAGGC